MRKCKLQNLCIYRYKQNQEFPTSIIGSPASPFAALAGRPAPCASAAFPAACSSAGSSRLVRRNRLPPHPRRCFLEERPRATARCTAAQRTRGGTERTGESVSRKPLSLSASPKKITLPGLFPSRCDREKATHDPVQVPELGRDEGGGDVYEPSHVEDVKHVAVRIHTASVSAREKSTQTRRKRTVGELA